MIITKKKNCRICGEKLELLKENKYLVETRKTEGMSIVLKSYECFDCPKCGCQNILNIREGREEKENSNVYVQKM